MDSLRIKPEKSKFLRYFKSYASLFSKERTGFYGNFGHGDIGDDAAFFAAAKLLDTSILALSKRCRAFNPGKLKALLIGGGGLLRWEAPYIPRRILLRDKWRFPVVLFSAGVNCDYGCEFRKDAKEKIKRLCEVCDYITVRDKVSQEFLKSLGVGKISILPDLELSLDGNPKTLEHDKKDSAVGIVLTPHSQFPAAVFDKMIKVFSQFSDYLADRGRNVLYIPFEASGSYDTKESEITKEVINNVKNKSRIGMLKPSSDPRELLFNIRSHCDFMVCTRLHSAVFAVNAGIPFFCVSYNLMHKGFLEMIDSPELELSIFEEFSFDNMVDKYEYVISNYKALEEKIINKKYGLSLLTENEIKKVKAIISEI
ncbi:MAG: polysaccharide pyruvyl transferase family protein [Candidatus Omnitrophica bacterium]|nr:polysaccharide pyruvyl transferase family protein [Candidatus Omnitrophota bacterium]MDD5429435.1 polysaccharide pyruvyl transferase family protein [Candidatus Omnitrophota bacterium]